MPPSLALAAALHLLLTVSLPPLSPLPPQSQSLLPPPPCTLLLPL